MRFKGFLLDCERYWCSLRDGSVRSAVIFGTSISSAYLSGATMLFRSLASELLRCGWKVAFVESSHDWLDVRADYSAPTGLTIYRYNDRASLLDILDSTELFAGVNLVFKFSGSSIGHDRFLDEWLATRRSVENGAWLLVYVDADAPMRLPYIRSHSRFYLHSILHSFDSVWVMLGGARASEEYREMGARHAFYLPAFFDIDAVQNAPESVDYQADLLFIGNPTPGRERALETLFFEVANSCPEMRFALAGAEWDRVPALQNLQVLGYVPSSGLASLYCGARLVLNVTREEMVVYGDVASLRLFEAAAFGACIISDDWRGLEHLFVPGEEVIIVRETADVVECLHSIGWAEARRIGDRARARWGAEHTCCRRIVELFETLRLVGWRG